MHVLDAPAGHSGERSIGAVVHAVNYKDMNQSGSKRKETERETNVIKLTEGS